MKIYVAYPNASYLDIAQQRMKDGVCVNPEVTREECVSFHGIDFDEALDFLKDLPRIGVFLEDSMKDRLKKILGPLYPEDESA